VFWECGLHEETNFTQGLSHNHFFAPEIDFWVFIQSKDVNKLGKKGGRRNIREMRQR
jgi:hypothetical protein